MNALQTALSNFAALDLTTGANALLAALGYNSDKTETLATPDAAGFAAAFSVELSKRAQTENWKELQLLFQLTGDELTGQRALLGQGYDEERFDSFLFFALDLKPTADGKAYSRTQLANMARELNKPFPMPVIVIFRHGDTMSLASLHRRQNKTHANRDVLESVVLLKDIRLDDPHRAHVDILRQLTDIKAKNWADFLKEWNRVLDISELNNAFYRDYKSVFNLVEESAILPAGHESKRRDWTQRLFNRLLFLRFLEKKGWLEFDGSHDYLRALWEAPRTASQTFLADRLHWAFFEGLNTTGEDAGVHALPDLIERRGHVPFLNGGLFDLQDALDVQGAVALENESAVFASILGLFERYYFTVDETTPLEQEIGIDPEMLGKVFEELVNGRHESGSYYTPRGIVSFMAREAIKGYLSPLDSAVAIEKFVDDNEAAELRDPEAVLAALRRVLICDPACGSGAYLLGTMQELLRLRETLFAAHAKDHAKIYERKLEIIARNLYGVDIDPFATNIAMLRLWLSLIVEFEGKTPPPLPNLKYKIENGDSLAAPFGGQLTLDGQTVLDFNAAKTAFMRAQHGDKRRLDEEVQTLRTELKQWSQTEQGFDWRIEFAEVFDATDGAGGFDIVLANPPFVRNGLIAPDYKQLMTANLGAANTGNTMDLYCYFYLRAFELLKVGGELAFISPNKWFRAAYGAKLRAFFAQNAHVRTIVDFGELPVFQNAATFPMVVRRFAKAVWNFSVDGKGNESLLTTETRVRCLDDASRKSFGFYWTFIQPFSGLIRREMLKIVKKKAETSA